jgi:hypothetical protein
VGPHGAALEGLEAADRRDDAHDRGKDPRDVAAVREHHGRVGKGAGGVRGRDPARGRGRARDRAPEPVHVADAEHAEGEERLAQVAFEDRRVVHVLAADALDGQELGAGAGRALEGLEHLVPVLPPPHVGGRRVLADVDGRDAQGGAQPRAALPAGESLAHAPRRLGAPRRLVGHGRQQLELGDEVPLLESDGALADAVDDPLVLLERGGHGGLVEGHGRKREVDLRDHRARADREAVREGEGSAGQAEA